jgi:monofunctional biosynthetic peptidoglycan transglycosylase
MAMLKKLSRWILRLLFWFFIVSVGSTAIFRFIPPPLTPLMVIRCFEQAFDENRDVRLYKDWVPLEKISAKLPLAVITSEDQKFDEHFGFDLEAIEKARKYNEKHRGRKVKGASTISQQTAKNVFLWPQRSYLRKGLEVYFTFLIELLWSKERIMEVYLNVIEMGDGIYGAEAAAQEYFRIPASRLNSSQSALIAACLPNPLRWRPDRPTKYINRKKQWILSRMGKVEKPEFIP